MRTNGCDDYTHGHLRSSCPACGVVVLCSFQINLTQHPVTFEAKYDFVCQECGHLVTKPAPEPVVRALLMAGVQMVTAEMPPAEALEPKSGPALTLDDLIDLHAVLEDEDLVAAFFESAAGSAS